MNEAKSFRPRSGDGSRALGTFPLFAFRWAFVRDENQINEFCCFPTDAICFAATRRDFSFKRNLITSANWKLSRSRARKLLVAISSTLPGKQFRNNLPDSWNCHESLISRSMLKSFEGKWKWRVKYVEIDWLSEDGWELGEKESSIIWSINSEANWNHEASWFNKCGLLVEQFMTSSLKFIVSFPICRTVRRRSWGTRSVDGLKNWHASIYSRLVKLTFRWSAKRLSQRTVSVLMFTECGQLILRSLQRWVSQSLTEVASWMELRPTPAWSLPVLRRHRATSKFLSAQHAKKTPATHPQSSSSPISGSSSFRWFFSKFSSKSISKLLRYISPWVLSFNDQKEKEEDENRQRWLSIFPRTAIYQKANFVSQLDISLLSLSL